MVIATITGSQLTTIKLIAALSKFGKTVTCVGDVGVIKL